MILCSFWQPVGFSQPREEGDCCRWSLPPSPPILCWIDRKTPTLKIPAKYQVRWFRPSHPTSDQPGIHNATGFFMGKIRFSGMGNTFNDAYNAGGTFWKKHRIFGRVEAAEADQRHVKHWYPRHGRLFISCSSHIRMASGSRWDNVCAYCRQRFFIVSF